MLSVCVHRDIKPDNILLDEEGKNSFYFLNPKQNYSQFAISYASFGF